MRGRAAAVLILLLACAPPARVRYEERLEEARPSEAHAIHAERLQEVMRGMERLLAERLPKAMDENWERQQRVEELAALARAIADSARWIRGDGSPSGWTPAQQSAIASNALELEERAGALATDAPLLNPEEIGARVEGLREACTACHSRFRRGTR